MGAKVQSKTYFPGSMTDLNNGFDNGAWGIYHGDRSLKISGSGNSQHYDYFLMTQTMGMDGYTGYAKEQIRQTILKHESIFKHQLQELHRLYKRQRDLMNPMPGDTSKLGHFLSQVSSDVSKGTHIFSSSFPLVDLTFSPLDSMKRKSTLNDSGPLRVSEKTVIDLELPANVDESNKWKQEEGKFQNLSICRGFNLADLNEPLQVEEIVFSTFVSNKNSINCLPKELQKRDSSAKTTIFGIEICEGNRTPTFHSSSGQLRAVNSESSIGLPWKNHEAPKRALPPWLTAKPCLQSEQIKAKDTTFHCINLDSLQNLSQQFFERAEMREVKKVKVDDTQSITKILGVPIPIINKNVENLEMKDLVEENGGKNCVSNMRHHHLDLNLSVDEDNPTILESTVKIATIEINLEAPAPLESNNSPGADVELIKAAAEAITSISSSKPREPPVDTLLWFADVISSKHFKKESSVNIDHKSTHEGMDYFEYMTLKLQDTKESYDDYKPITVEEEDEAATFSKRTPRKGQGKRGRQRKDFQKDVLPSIVSLSRREVTEDLLIFEDAFSAAGVSWQSTVSKKKTAARNHRSRPHSVVPDLSCSPPAAVEQTICAEISLGKSLGGWGRRLLRQRCQNGGRKCNLLGC